MSLTKIADRPTEAFRNLFPENAAPNPQEWELIAGKFGHRSIGKHEALLSVGEVCDKIWFLTKGVIRYCNYDVDNQEITRCFALENQFCFSLSSYLNDTPAQEGLIALEDCEVLEIGKDDFNDLKESIPRLKMLYIRLLEESYLLLDAYNFALQNLSATTRYQKLILEDAPELLQRVPQVYLASYLGISPETLSRIRKKK